ncbi:helix-turn-helix transcriptional regulator [Streptomyces sp. NPDC005962]|uniref:helix-turn-helix domain-containing protein n=1 Tax=Streptomyces sp. NPDC005962 TaxID=3154466 RepID=UPI0033CD1F7F
MPPRSNPTARQVRLGSELRRLREAAGMSASEVGDFLGGGHPQISNLEAGRYGISEERLRTLAAHYSCDDAALLDAMCAMAVTVRGKSGWWEEYRGVLAPGLLDLADLEHHAAAMRAYHISHIPGLLQTEDHMRAIFAYSTPPLPPDTLEVRVEHRRRRSAALAEEPVREYEAIVHEAALRMRFGGRKVARAQLRHILELSDRWNVTIRVVPFEADGFAGSGTSITYLEGAVRQLDTVQLDSEHDSILVDAEAQLKRYRKVLDRMRDASLAAEDSRDFMHRLVCEI